MSAQVGPGDPQWSFNILEFERQAAIFLKANAITTDSGRATFVAALSAAQTTAAVKALLNCLQSGPTLG